MFDQVIFIAPLLNRRIVFEIVTSQISFSFLNSLNAIPQCLNWSALWPHRTLHFFALVVATAAFRTISFDSLLCSFSSECKFCSQCLTKSVAVLHGCTYNVVAPLYFMLFVQYTVGLQIISERGMLNSWLFRFWKVAAVVETILKTERSNGTEPLILRNLFKFSLAVSFFKLTYIILPCYLATYQPVMTAQASYFSPISTWMIRSAKHLIDPINRLFKFQASVGLWQQSDVQMSAGQPDVKSLKQL
jgi:hypothetical protein